MRNLLELLNIYSDKYNLKLTPTEKNLLTELKNKIVDIEDLDININTLISQCFANSLIKFDAKTGMLSFGGLNLKLKRANPKEDISLSGMSVAYTKDPNVKSALISKELGRLQRELERNTVQYYYAAHRIIKICDYLPGLKGFRCSEISIVRNKLIEHPEKEGGIVLDTFSYDMHGGPFIKGMRASSQSNVFPSKGWRYDSQKFVEKLTKKVELALK
jgi:hypothetical protein